MSDPSSDFLVGQTIRLKVEAFDQDTGQPFDPAVSVVLDALIKTGAGSNTAVSPLPDPSTFTRISQGVFVLMLDTENLDAGVYTWRAKGTDSQLGKSLHEDTFVLTAKTA